PLGVIQLLNRHDGIFSADDEEFVEIFGNHAAMFIEIAQLQLARIEALEQSRMELERLNRVKGKALDHLSHELKTPLSVSRGNLHLLKNRLPADPSSPRPGPLLEGVGRNMGRLLAIEEAADTIIRSHRDLKGGALPHDGSPGDAAGAEPILLRPFAE